ncbi:MAG: hypothetical protein A2275_07070 [Bacteroidetes bacterium RIFOXYA12_FULL_35_11]|nr:MAG: hypothetical protein A2X01_17510 [Bacteroidetes bacterium GWF2_35_48]OFY74152.1 MAG: hypothetical protein A2275_07070 [Bacteroidetes bacterium RIFOXYA12_FULL_35_11]OFY94331.1 MAG: hypothetical protein A2491_00690 [Bacteroidetes bacterium RIFOXYC12_FULL_35_7]OFY97693.1 MAG: hypothetical protein A2309_03290 [Bacteroidetes bacterium RIFOXYB2_FULL_35_7]HBX49629.1 acyl carrier protein [Bacteroidales bacterium]
MILLEIKDKIQIIFREVFREPSLELKDELSANDVAKWDSLHHMTMIAAVEKEFKIKFKLKELVAMKNAGDLLRAVETKLI